MKPLLLSALAFFCFAIPAMEETPDLALNIADAVPGGCRALTVALLQYGADGGGARNQRGPVETAEAGGRGTRLPSLRPMQVAGEAGHGSVLRHRHSRIRHGRNAH